MTTNPSQPPRPAQQPARPRPPVTQAQSAATRAYSKRITAATLAAFFALAGYGMWSGNPQTAEIISALGPWAIGLIAVYMAVGLGDYRTAKGVPGIMDVLTLLVTKGAGGGRPGGRAG